LVPVIGLIPTSALLADHYTYLSSVGIAIMLAWSIPSIITSEEAKRKFIFPAAIIVLAVLIILTWNQCGYWKNGIDLWNHAVKVIKNNHHAYLRLGYAYDALGDKQRAIYNFDKVIRLKPNDHTAYNGRGIIYFRLGQYQQAIDNYNYAIRLKPDYADAYNNRALIYLNQKNDKLGCNDARKACSMGICAALEEAKSVGYCH
jgi:tetratricopeptide (TPR) repeat protein